MNPKTIVVQAPGRINIIGEHTDYNDGYVLPAAVDKKATFRLSKNNTESAVNIYSENIGNHYSFDLNDFKPIQSGWENYVMGVVHELQELGANIGGFDGQFGGDVPIGGGMSSSAALECSLAFGLNELFNLGLHEFQLIKASQMAEHNFVGIKCGIMDQFASVMGKKDQVILLDCRSLEYKYFPFELGDYQMLLLNTNVSHSLSSSAYNTRREECESGVDIIKVKYPDVLNLRDVNLEILEEFKAKMSENVYNRCFHVVTENQRVLDATDALNEGNFSKLGELMYGSHFSLQNDYKVSCVELDFLVNVTLDKDYVLGSRMMGGGFGGCTINLIEKKYVDEFIKLASTKYFKEFGVHLTPYSVSIENGVELV